MNETIRNNVLADLHAAKYILTHSPLFLNITEVKDTNLLNLAELIQKERHRLEDIENGK